MIKCFLLLQESLKSRVVDHVDIVVVVVYDVDFAVGDEVVVGYYAVVDDDD